MTITTLIRAALFSVALFASGLTAGAATLERIGPPMSHPWGMEFLDHDTVLVTVRSGGLLRVDLADGTTTAITGLPEVFDRRQGGLLDVAMIDGHVYLCYSAMLDGGSSTAIDRAVIKGNTLVRRETIFTGNNPSRSGHHFGCRLQVTGGMIYASLGDRGARDNAQDPATHAGSLIRINLDGSIPHNNPKPAGLADGGADGWAPEIFTIGHRNPQGMAMHPRTGDIWTHEHGPRGGDEINIIHPGRDGGANYGWPTVSHGREYATGRRVSDHNSLAGHVDPVWVWDPSIAPSGMAFYPDADDTNDSGRMFPEFRGHLLVGSLKFRRLYLVELDTGSGLPASERVILDGQIGRIRDVAVAPHGPFAGALLLLSDEAQGGLYMMTR